jgi:hypothetical protein
MPYSNTHTVPTQTAFQNKFCLFRRLDRYFRHCKKQDKTDQISITCCFCVSSCSGKIKPEMAGLICFRGNIDGWGLRVNTCVTFRYREGALWRENRTAEGLDSICNIFLRCCCSIRQNLHESGSAAMEQNFTELSPIKRFE